MGGCHQASVLVSAYFRMSLLPPLFYYYYAVLFNFAFNVTFCHLLFCQSQLTVFSNKIFAQNFVIQRGGGNSSWKIKCAVVKETLSFSPYNKDW